MAASLSAGQQRLLQEAQIANIATVMPDGTPQITPVWVDTDGTHIIFNTAEGRQKTRNLRRDAKVAVSVVDSANAYRWLSVRGRVVEMTHEGADAHIDKMAKKYLNQDTYPWRSATEQRVIVRILPERITGQGTDE